MKWLFVSLLIVHTLPCILTGQHKKVKILVPMPVQHVHHTKVVKVPEYHHYFHDRKQQPHPKRYHGHGHGHSHSDFEAYDRDPALYDEGNYFHGPAFNDFDYFPDTHDRQHTPALPPTKYLNVQNTGSKRQAQYPPNGHNALNGNRRRNPYEPQHFYHRL